MQVEVFSDVVCPWCYIGKRHLETALASFPHADEVTVTFRSFQLDPHAPKDSDASQTANLAEKYGISEDQARAMMHQVESAGARAGLTFDFESAHTANTFDAHRLLHFAASRGKQAELTERLMAAHFTNGERVGNNDTLVALAAEVGLDADEAREVLDSDGFADDVRADFSLARSFGISSVPFFVIDRTYGISGAQPAETLRASLEQAWSESHPLVMTAADGDGCADGSCQV